MSELTAIFRADASVEIGGGHVMRCLSLAHGLIGRGWRCTFAGTAETQRLVKAMTTSGTGFLEVGNDDPSALIDRLAVAHGTADTMIVDHYGLDKVFETESRRLAKLIVCIDDLADRSHDCDILLDQSLGRKAEDYQSLVPSGTLVLTGPSYALLRPEFARLRPAALARRARPPEKSTRVFMAFGATDAHDMTSKALRALSSFDPERWEIDVVLSSRAQHLNAVRAMIAGRHNVTLHIDSQKVADLMANADLALGAGGGTTLERCSLGLPALVVTTAENQDLQSRCLEQAGAAIVLGDHDTVTEDAIRAAVSTLIANPSMRAKMSECAASLCDGGGVQRVVESIEERVLQSVNR